MRGPAPVIYSDMHKQTDIDALVCRLDELLLERNTRVAFPLLDGELSDGVCVNSSHPSYIALVLCAAEWNDLGYRSLDWFSALKEKLPAKSPAMPWINYLRLQMIDAYHCLATERPAHAIEILARVIASSEDVLPLPHLFLTRFWKGRAHRQKGEYADAAVDLRAAQEYAERARAPRLVAVTRIHESWLAFQASDSKRALELLDEAEAVLKPIGHALSLGNIESARGRFVRRTGDYITALQHFDRAIALYSRDFPHHPNLARALVNSAYVKRLQALDLKPFLARKTGKRVSNEEYLTLTRDALALLQRAAELYKKTGHLSGLGSALVNAGHLHLESGDIEQAAAHAEQSFALSQGQQDHILRARTRSLQSAIERARSDEQLSAPPDADRHAGLAISHAEDAIEYAGHTQNKRLLAEAYIARGWAAMDDSVLDVETARDYAARAGSLLDPFNRDHLVKELAALKALILKTADIEDPLRRWSNGQFGNKTFLQVQEEFAELIIPKVWMNLGRNVAEVARQLSMSPKKVRRILRNSGHKE